MNPEKIESKSRKTRTDLQSIREPLQERSRRNMDRIMESLEALLEQMPFDRITIAELARVSGVGTSSIYARFVDKRALILGVHLRVRENSLSCLEQLADPRSWSELSLEKKVRRILLHSISFYRKHKFVIRAALFVDDVEVKERQASVLRNAAEKFSVLFVGENIIRNKDIEAAVDASVRLVTSVMYAEIMFDTVVMIRKPVSDRMLVAQLTTAVVALLSEASKDKN